MTYYSVDKILEIIKMYHVNIKNVHNFSKEMASVGVAQYGIEASLPKGTNISDIVEKEAIRQIEGNKVFAEIITDIKYLQDRWDRVTNDTDAHILKLRLDGLSAHDIGQILNRTDRMIHIRLRRIAETIKGVVE